MLMKLVTFGWEVKFLCNLTPPLKENNLPEPVTTDVLHQVSADQNEYFQTAFEVAGVILVPEELNRKVDGMQ